MVYLFTSHVMSFEAILQPHDLPLNRSVLWETKQWCLKLQSPPKPTTGDGQGFMATKSTFRAKFHRVYLMSREVFALRRTEVRKDVLKELLGPFQDSPSSRLVSLSV